MKNETQIRVICTRIREAREAKDITAAEMADVLELHPRAWSRYERDAVPWKHMRQIAEALGVSVGWLLNGELDEAHVLRELVDAVTTQSRAIEALLADVETLVKRVERMNANAEKLQDSLLPNAERYRGRPDRGRGGGAGTAVAIAEAPPG